MRCILFCDNAYSFGILSPIREELKKNNFDYLWYIAPKLNDEFPFNKDEHTNDIKYLKQYLSDFILVPGNEVPYFLRGLKVQLFHGLAGEKKGHFKIRHYFDLYLTPGPYFTRRFQKLSMVYKNFKVVETGWSKFDLKPNKVEGFQNEKSVILNSYGAQKIIIYAPTFSPKLCSAPALYSEIGILASNTQNFIFIKFHDLMNQKLVSQFEKISRRHKNILIIKDRNITKYLHLSDLMISDTSSVIYEFLLLDKPVITFKTKQPKKSWENILHSKDLHVKVESNLKDDPYKKERAKIISEYHPYQDSKSSERIIQAIKKHIKEHGIPKKRNLSLFRMFKMNKKYK